jgi:hypothetical protein
MRPFAAVVNGLSALRLVAIKPVHPWAAAGPGILMDGSAANDQRGIGLARPLRIADILTCSPEGVMTLSLAGAS